MKGFLLFVAILALFVPPALGAEYWGSKQSNKYHLPTCKWAQKIKRENLVVFHSPEEAEKAGYRPCRVCRPTERRLPEKHDDGRPEPGEKGPEGEEAN